MKYRYLQQSSFVRNVFGSIIFSVDRYSPNSGSRSFRADMTMTPPFLTERFKRGSISSTSLLRMQQMTKRQMAASYLFGGYRYVTALRRRMEISPGFRSAQYALKCFRCSPFLSMEVTEN